MREAAPSHSRARAMARARARARVPKGASIDGRFVALVALASGRRRVAVCVATQAWAWQHVNEGWRLSLSVPSVGSGECRRSHISLPAMPGLRDFPELRALR